MFGPVVRTWEAAGERGDPCRETQSTREVVQTEPAHVRQPRSVEHVAGAQCLPSGHRPDLDRALLGTLSEVDVVVTVCDGHGPRPQSTGSGGAKSAESTAASTSGIRRSSPGFQEPPSSSTGIPASRATVAASMHRARWCPSTSRAPQPSSAPSGTAAAELLTAFIEMTARPCSVIATAETGVATRGPSARPPPRHRPR